MKDIDAVNQNSTLLEENEKEVGGINISIKSAKCLFNRFVP